MNRSAERHVPEDALEQYAMGKLGSDEAAPLEEHLLICPRCLQRLDETEDYIRVIRAALFRLPSAPGMHQFHLVSEHRHYARRST